MPIDAGRLQFVGAPPEADEVEEDDDDLCWVCGSAEDSEHLLLCDTEGCGAAYHMHCLDPPLTKPPLGDWSCKRCARFASQAPTGRRPAKSRMKNTNRSAPAEDSDSDIAIMIAAAERLLLPADEGPSAFPARGRAAACRAPPAGRGRTRAC